MTISYCTLLGDLEATASCRNGAYPLSSCQEDLPESFDELSSVQTRGLPAIEAAVLSEFLFSAVGVLPWRCTACETRFHARAIPLRHLLYTRCGTCGNLELQRIAVEKVLGVTSIVGRWLGLPAVRCVPCRNNFFSLRPMLPAERHSWIAAEDGAAKY